MSILKNKHTSNQLKDLLIEVKDLRETVEENKLSVDEINREMYRICEIGNFITKDSKMLLYDNIITGKIADEISIINKFMADIIGDKRLDMHKATGYKEFWGKEIVNEELLDVYNKMEEVYDLRQIKTHLEPSMGFDNSRGYMMFGGITFRQIYAYNSFNHHILNFDIMEANHSLYEFIGNYHINGDKPLSNIEKFLVNQMIKSLRYIIKIDMDSKRVNSLSEERVKEFKDIISKMDVDYIIKSAKDMGVEVKSNSKIGREYSE